MRRRSFANVRGVARSALLLLIVVGFGVSLAVWKYSSLRAEEAASANQPEPTEVVSAAVAEAREHRRTITSVGTVLALRSVTLRNELAGTVRQVRLVPGSVVEPGALLVALDVSVEEAELKALQAQAALAETTLERMRRLGEHQAVAQQDVDQARADRDVALAQIARTRASIGRKIIRAPFRARVGLADVHPGQYLNEGTLLTTLQGVDDKEQIDFTVPQRVAAVLRVGDQVAVYAAEGAPGVPARIVAIDARVDSTTRNAMVRAVIPGGPAAPTPGASARVVVPVGPQVPAVVVPASALRKGPAGDHIYVLAPDSTGRLRARLRQVESGPLLGDEIVILRGVSAGERVAASGSFKLRDGALVSVPAPAAEAE
jgi:membrane fusion protein (multidrug efflux system)